MNEEALEVACKHFQEYRDDAVASVRKELNKTRRELRALGARHDRLVHRERSLETEREVLKEENARLRTELRQMASFLSCLEGQCSDRRTELAKTNNIFAITSWR
jgi:septal ring factor EnvC (AmiA/AmiB activator)